MATSFERVRFDIETERYTDSRDNPLLFPRTLRIRRNGKVETVRISFTRSVMGLATVIPVACIKDGEEKIFLDDPEIEIDSMCCVIDG